jgi:hypothetical protein
MSSSMKNILVVLAAFTVSFGGYYMYVQNKNSSLSTGSSEVTADILLSTQVFIERRVILDAVSLNVSLFENPVFRSYRSFAQPVSEEPYGRTNPFARPSGTRTTSNR